MMAIEKTPAAIVDDVPQVHVPPTPAATAALEPPLDFARATLALYARVLGAGSFSAASHHLVASLVQDHGYERASIGYREHGRTRLLASSNMDPNNADADLPQRLVGAMDEALEQGVSLSWPDATPVAGAAPKSIAAIRIEHEQLHRHVSNAVATVPLGVGSEACIAVCVERSEPIVRGDLVALEQMLTLAAPALRWMQQGMQPWHRRAWRDLMQACAKLRRPEQRAARHGLIGAALLLVFIAAVPLEDGTGGRAHIEGAEQRIVVAPADGYVKTAHVRPGDRVKAGDALVDLVEGDLRLERERWGSQIAQHENAYAAAMAKSDRVLAATSMARAGEAQAQLSLVDEQIARGRLVAPFDATVIQGDLTQTIGAPVRQGDTLLTLATTGQHRVIVEVDEVDIARIQTGQRGTLKVSSLPWDRQDLVVERIAPLAKAVDGRNVFEVEARLASPQASLRPGLLGRAEIVTGRIPPLWGWTRHAIDRMRVAYWAWLG